MEVQGATGEIKNYNWITKQIVVFLFLLNEINRYKQTTVIPGTQLNAVAFYAGNMDWISRETTQMHGQGCLFQNGAQETPSLHSTPHSTEQGQCQS